MRGTPLSANVPPKLNCAPFISGPLWWFDPYESTRWGESGWRDELDQHRAKMIRKTDIDVIMLQDSGEHFSYVTNEQRRPMLRAMRDACRESGAGFWGNVETAEFECPSIEEYVRRYARVHHSTVKNAPWRPVPIERLKGKLELAAEYAERIVTWGYREFCRPDLGPTAKKWYEDYRAYYASRWSCRESR